MGCAIFTAAPVEMLTWMTCHRRAGPHFHSAHWQENSDPLRASTYLEDGALASKMMLVTHVESCKDSCRGAKHKGFTTQAGDAK